MMAPCVPRSARPPAVAVLVDELTALLRVDDNDVSPAHARLLTYLRSVPRAKADAYLAALRDFGQGHDDE